MVHIRDLALLIRDDGLGRSDGSDYPLPIGARDQFADCGHGLKAKRLTPKGRRYQHALLKDPMQCPVTGLVEKFPLAGPPSVTTRPLPVPTTANVPDTEIGTVGALP